VPAAIGGRKDLVDWEEWKKMGGEMNGAVKRK
jgi:hypothetical protein